LNWRIVFAAQNMLACRPHRIRIRGIMKRFITIFLSVILAMSIVKPAQATLWNFSYTATSVAFGTGSFG
jgi:hypothetical protein